MEYKFLLLLQLIVAIIRKWSFETRIDNYQLLIKKNKYQKSLKIQRFKISAKNETFVLSNIRVMMDTNSYMIIALKDV